MDHERLETFEGRLDRLEEKVDMIMEQVQLGRHLILFAKLVGWFMASGAATLEVYHQWRGK